MKLWASSLEIERGAPSGPNTGQKWTHAQINAVVDLFNKETNVHVIANYMQRGVKSVCNVLKREGLIYKDLNDNYYTNDEEPKEQINMPIIENKTFIRGKDASCMDDDEIFQFIAKLEQDSDALSKIVNKPMKLAKKIEAIQEDIAKLVAYVDGR